MGRRQRSRSRQLKHHSKLKKRKSSQRGDNDALAVVAKATAEAKDLRGPVLAGRINVSASRTQAKEDAQRMQIAQMWKLCEVDLEPAERGVGIGKK